MMKSNNWYVRYKTQHSFDTPGPVNLRLHWGSIKGSEMLLVKFYFSKTSWNIACHVILKGILLMLISKLKPSVFSKLKHTIFGVIMKFIYFG